MSFLSRLSKLRKIGRPLICAEGYLFEMERRGWVQVGPFVPEVVLSDPYAVKQLHREFVRCGSDVIQAFTYYAHREKLKMIGKEDLVQDLNRKALDIAFEVQSEFLNEEDIPLVAGGICNSTIYEPNNKENDEIIKNQFREQLELFHLYNVDYCIGETFDWFGEAILAAQVINEYGIPSVITLASVKSNGISNDGVSPIDGCKILRDEYNVNVVGLNCSRGPKTMLPILKDIKNKLVHGYDGDINIAALPVCYQTDHDHPTMQTFGELDEKYLILDCHTCTRFELAQFAKDCMNLGINYIGTCCGGAPHHIRSMSEAIGKNAIASKYSPDLSKHYTFGDRGKHPFLKQVNVEYAPLWGISDTLY